MTATVMCLCFKWTFDRLQSSRISYSKGQSILRTTLWNFCFVSLFIWNTTWISIMSKVMSTPKYFFSVSQISCTSKNSCSNDSVTEICIPVIENIRWKHYQIINLPGPFLLKSCGEGEHPKSANFSEIWLERFESTLMYMYRLYGINSSCPTFGIS